MASTDLEISQLTCEPLTNRVQAFACCAATALTTRMSREQSKQEGESWSVLVRAGVAAGSLSHGEQAADQLVEVLGGKLDKEVAREVVDHCGQQVDKLFTGDEDAQQSWIGAYQGEWVRSPQGLGGVPGSESCSVFENELSMSRDGGTLEFFYRACESGEREPSGSVDLRLSNVRFDAERSSWIADVAFSNTEIDKPVLQRTGQLQLDGTALYLFMQTASGSLRPWARFERVGAD